MSAQSDYTWDKMDYGVVDNQEPECEWNVGQLVAVVNFMKLFGITHPVHDYYPSFDQDCMILRFTREPRGVHGSQFYSVNMSITESKGIYLLLDGEKFSKKLSLEQRNAIIQLYNSIANKS